MFEDCSVTDSGPLVTLLITIVKSVREFSPWLCPLPCVMDFLKVSHELPCQNTCSDSSGMRLLKLQVSGSKPRAYE